MGQPATGIAHAGSLELTRGGFFLPKESGSVVTAKTADYTVLSSDAWKAFSNSGASGSVTFTLPDPSTVLGLPFHIFKKTNQTVVLDPSGSATINGAATLSNTASEAGAAWVTAVAISATEYVTTAKLGTWA